MSYQPMSIQDIDPPGRLSLTSLDIHHYDDGMQQTERRWLNDALDDIDIQSPTSAQFSNRGVQRNSQLSLWPASLRWAAETLIALNLDSDVDSGRPSSVWADQHDYRHASVQTLTFTTQSPRGSALARPPWYEEIHGRPNSWLAEEERLPAQPLIIKRKPVPERGLGTETKAEIDHDLISWSGPNDPENPKNFSSKQKWGILFAISSITLLSPLTSSIMAPALPVIAADLGIRSEIESSLCLSIYILGFALGPLVLAPLSEVYGRTKVLQLSMLFYMICNTGCGFAQNSATLLILRLLSGSGGSAPLVVGTGVIRPAERGRAVSIWGLGPLLGPALGPLIGAFITAGTTWRWMFWSVSIADVVIQLIALFLLPETYNNILLQRRLERLQTQTGNMNLHLAADAQQKSLSSSLRTALSRPFRFLFTQPIIQVIALYMAYIFGLFYLLLTSFPSVWQDIYHERIQIAGLNYLSLGIGYIIGAQFNGYLNDKIYSHLKSRNNGKAIPEFRVPLVLIGSILMPIGLFWYGWSARPSVHWIVPNIGIAVFSAGSVLCLQCMQTYVIDCYTKFAASGIAAAVVLRSVAGFAFPLFAPKLYDNLGMGWGTSVLGFVCVAVGIPSPIIFWVWGRRLREKSTYAAAG